MPKLVYLVQSLPLIRIGSTIEKPVVYETLSLAVADFYKAEQIGGDDQIGLWRASSGIYLITCLHYYEDKEPV